MGVGCEKNFVMDRACEDLNGQVPISLADDIGCAARSDPYSSPADRMKAGKLPSRSTAAAIQHTDRLT